MKDNNTFLKHEQVQEGKLVQSNVGADTDQLWARLKLGIRARRDEKGLMKKVLNV